MLFERYLNLYVFKFQIWVFFRGCICTVRVSSTCTYTTLQVLIVTKTYGFSFFYSTWNRIQILLSCFSVIERIPLTDETFILSARFDQQKMPPVRERYSYKIFKISSLCIVPTLSENRAQTSLAYLVTFYRYLFCILGNNLWGKCRFEQMVVIISPMLTVKRSSFDYNSE